MTYDDLAYILREVTQAENVLENTYMQFADPMCHNPKDKPTLPMPVRDKFLDTFKEIAALKEAVEAEQTREASA